MHFLSGHLRFSFSVVTHTTGMMVAAMSWNLIQHWCSVRTSSWRYFPVSSCSTLLVLTTSFFNTNTICVQKTKLLNTSLPVFFLLFIPFRGESYIQEVFVIWFFKSFTDVTGFYHVLSISVKLNLDLKTSYLFNVSGGDKVKSQGQGLFPHF